MQRINKIKDLKKLDKLAFSALTAHAALTILKIIIFVNNFNKRVILAIYLQNLLSKHIKNNRKMLIKMFTFILKLDTKAEYLKKLCNINIKIWICIDAASIEVDIGNII